MPGNLPTPERDLLRRLLAEMKRRLVLLGVGEEGTTDALVAAVGNAEIREELMSILGIHDFPKN